MAGAGANAHTVDWSQMSCLDSCRNLYNAILAATTSGRRVRVAYDNYQVEYKPEDYGQLRELYMTLRAQCPEALAQLPNLQPGARVRRGPPLWGSVRR